jgi:hypothetical protein
MSSGAPNGLESTLRFFSPVLTQLGGEIRKKQRGQLDTAFKKKNCGTRVAHAAAA